MTEASGTPPLPNRNLGIDLARGLAVVMMIETHALDGWVNAADKLSLGYRFSRVFSNIPAPLFLLLAGLSLGLQAERAERTGKHPAQLRHSMAMRALEVVGYGYLVSLIYAILDFRFALATILRADILHCIGLSLLVCTYFLVGRSAIRGRVLTLCVLGLLLGLCQRFVPPLPLPLASVLGLLVDVAPITRFPLLPLCGFAAIGFWVGHSLRPTEWPVPKCLLWAAVAVALVYPLSMLTHWTLAALGGRLSRAHPAVVWNFLEGTARALSVLSLSLALAVKLPPSTYGFLLRLGRGSLLAYGFHIPLCYGRVATPILGKLSIGPATALLVLLIGLTWLVVWGRDTWQASTSPPRGPAGKSAKAAALSLIFALLWFVPTHASAQVTNPTQTPAPLSTPNPVPAQVAKRLAAQGRYALAYSLTEAPEYRERIATPTEFFLRAEIDRSHQLFKSGLFRESADAYALLYVMRPDLPQSLFNIGQALRRAGEHEPALTFYRRYLDVEPQTSLRAEVEGYIRELTALLSAHDQLGRKPTPVYKKAWFWLTIGSAVAVTTAVVVGVTIGTRSPAPPPTSEQVLGPFEVVFPR